MREVPLHPDRCGPCDDCAEFLAERARKKLPETTYGLGFPTKTTYPKTPLALRDLRPPSAAQFLRHAELYGTECVFETAQQFLAGLELVQLALELTRIESERRKPFAPGARPTRLSHEQEVDAVALLVGEGVPHTRIAKHLQRSERHIRRLARELREGRRRGRERRSGGRARRRNRTEKANPADDIGTAELSGSDEGGDAV